ncbi:hypothetical protein JDV02_003077 [Purpureocillium takamizusanense]|uniref:Uncharacterized protein n=1 Tax=Purpureocillium takamizusanense TaxID=2060973 RepID=A0A9Q8QBQ2_9HYPO|nr:uncharacterized protein JDV02_003077 [Purpureocillium takamizusanense]UNI16660.1 hypothetical protein JDV02_003077 [Purpureocillium takamizusanense]
MRVWSRDLGEPGISAAQEVGRLGQHLGRPHFIGSRHARCPGCLDQKCPVNLAVATVPTSKSEHVNTIGSLNLRGALTEKLATTTSLSDPHVERVLAQRSIGPGLDDPPARFLEPFDRTALSITGGLCSTSTNTAWGITQPEG